MNENHPNPNEIFPPWTNIGAPGGSAKAMAAVLAAAAALAALVGLMLSIFCIPMEIFQESAVIQVRIRNREGQAVTWYLSYFEEGREDSEGPLVILEDGTIAEDISQLDLDDLKPGTWYELWFYPEGSEDLTKPVHRFRFRTPGPGEGDPEEPGTPDDPDDPGESSSAPGGEPEASSAVTTETTTETTEETTEETTTETTEPGNSYSPPSRPINPTQPPATISKQPPRGFEPEMIPDEGSILDYPGYTLQYFFQLNDAIPTRATYSYQGLIYGDQVIYGNGAPQYEVTGNVPQPNVMEATFTPPAEGYTTVAVPIQMCRYGVRNLVVTLYYEFADGSTGSVTTDPLNNLPGFLYNDCTNVQARYNSATGNVDVSMEVGAAPKGYMWFELDTNVVSYGGGTTTGILDYDDTKMTYTFSVPYDQVVGAYPTIAVIDQITLVGDNWLGSRLDIPSAMSIQNVQLTITGLP